MRPQEYMRWIWELERRFAVDDWRVAGADLWPVARVQLASALRATGDTQPQGGTVQDSPRGVRKLVQAILAQHRATSADHAHNALPVRCADVLVLHHSAYRSLAGGVYYDRLLDYLREELSRRGITSLGLEYCPSGAFRAPRALPTHYIQDELHFANLRNRVHCGVSSADVQRMWHYRDVVLAAQAAGASVPGLAPRLLARQAGLLNRWAALFTHYLKSSEAKLALTTYYYSMEGMALCLAARRLGIPCVDVQHGVQGHSHFAYAPWQGAPENSFNTLPTVFWCWDDESAIQLGDWVLASGGYVFTGGNPWQALWEDTSSPVTTRELARIDAVLAAWPGRKHILLSLQWDAGLTAGLRELIAASPGNWHWWVRPHPVQAGGRGTVRAALEQCAPGRYELDLAADAPLPLLLARLDAHVTRSSTVVREAAQAGLRSLMLDPAARDYYSTELASGLAVTAESTADALAALAGILVQPRGETRRLSHRAQVGVALAELCALAGLDTGRAAPG